MIKSFCVPFVCFVVGLAACAQRKAIYTASAEERPIAFPGADGFGKYTTGGRGGKVVVVTNLQNSGPGSFREACEMGSPRVIVFAVAGTIHLDSKLYIKGNATIAGQTAPGDGICVADNSVQLGGNNIIVRYLRFRMGDKYQKGGMVDGNGGDDAFGGTRFSHIIIDHCTMSWSTDEAFSVYGGDSTTLQWNLVSEPMNYSYHFEKGDKDYEHHGYGGIWGGKHTSAHHNLLAHCVSRTPRFDGARNIPSELVDFRNNVIYDWQINNAYAGEGGTYNIVNNYYRPGPSTSESVKSRIVNPYKLLPRLPYGKFYVSGNVSEPSNEVTADNWKGVVMNGGTDADKEASKAAGPFAAIAMPTQTAEQAYQLVLKGAGASFRRDTLDERIINDVVNRTGRIIDVQGGYPHGTPYEQTIHAWPQLKVAPAKPDLDKDGMPDEWERKNGLNPADPADAAAVRLHLFYTNIEVYANSLLK